MAIKSIISILATIVALVLAALLLLANPTHSILPDSFILQVDNTSNWNWTHHNYTRLYYLTTCTGWTSRDASHYYDHDEICEKRRGGYSYHGTGYGSQAHSNEQFDVNIELLSPFATLVLGIMCASALVIAQGVFTFSKSSPNFQRWNQPILTILSTLSFQFTLTSSLLIWNLMMSHDGPLQTACLQCGWPQPQFINITWALLAFSAGAMFVEWFALWTWWRSRMSNRESALPLYSDAQNLVLHVPRTVENAKV